MHTVTVVPHHRARTLVALVLLLAVLVALFSPLPGGVPRAGAREARQSPTFPIQINFQPASGATTPPFHLPDTGAVYGPRSAGLIYGWEKDNSGWARVRNIAPGQTCDSVQYIGLATQVGSSANRWELALPNGLYRVTVNAGDRGNFGGSLKLAVEGTTFIDIPSFSGPGVHGAAKDIKLVDGKLTLTGYDRVCSIRVDSIRAKVQYKTFWVDPNQPTKTITAHFRIVNTGTANISLPQLRLRYWYTRDGATQQAYVCDYATVGCGGMPGFLVPLSLPRYNADTYLELRPAFGTLPAGASTDIMARVIRNDGASYTLTNDYSFNAIYTSYTDWTRVTLSHAGTLIWGTEP